MKTQPKEVKAKVTKPEVPKVIKQELSNREKAKKLMRGEK